MKCLLNKNLWENIGCTLNTVNPSRRVTKWQLILLSYLAKIRPMIILSCPYFTNPKHNNAFHGFCIQLSCVVASPSPKCTEKLLGNSRVLDAVTVGRAVLGRGKEGIASTGVHWHLTACCQPFCNWLVATEILIKNLVSPNLRKHLEPDQLPRKSRFCKVGLNILYWISVVLRSTVKIT